MHVSSHRHQVHRDTCAESEYLKKGKQEWPNQSFTNMDKDLKKSATRMRTNTPQKCVTSGHNRRAKTNPLSS